VLGLSLVVGSFSRRVATHRSRSALTRSHRETDAVRADRDRLTHERDASGDGRAAHSEPSADPPGSRR
jgi:hypothetical protein